MRKFIRIWVESYPSIAKVNEAIAGPRRRGSERSVENYVKAVRRFVFFLGVDDPEKALQKLRSGEIDAAAKADQFIDYALKKYAHGTVRNFLFGIKKWYEVNGVKADWEKIELPTSTEISETDRAPSKEELKTLLTHASSSRDRAVIYIDTSSGLRIGTLLSLKIGNVNFSYPDVAGIKVERQLGRKFVGRRGRGAGRVYYTFMTPEAKEELKKYLEERKRAGEKLTPESPLIGDVYHKGKFLTIEDFERVWYRLLKRAGLDEKSNKWYLLHLHTLRKYFRSNCIGVDASYREHWMGHKGGYLDESYFRAEEGKHLAEYRKAVPYLTVYSASTDEEQLRKKSLLDFAKLQGYPEEELKRLEEVLARSKNTDEAIREFRRFQEKEDCKTLNNGNGKYFVVKGEDDLIQRLDDGWKLVQPLNHEKYLLQHS
jgi:integrase